VRIIFRGQLHVPSGKTRNCIPLEGARNLRRSVAESGLRQDDAHPIGKQ